MNGLIAKLPRYEPWAFRLAILVLLLLLAQATAGLLWDILAPTTRVVVSAPAMTQAAGTGASTSRAGVSPVTEDLFGEPVTATVTSIEDAPDTKLDLSLIGVFATGDSSALAIIASGRRPEALFAVGDDLPGGATLRAIYADRVILERNGDLETLRLPQESLGGLSTTDGPTGTVRTDASLGSQLQAYRREAMRNPASMAEYVEAQPVEQGGRFLGYRLILKKDVPVFNELGLSPGDIITEVNGIALDQPDAGIRALRQLATAREINLTVLRNGRTETVQANFGQ